MSHLESNDTGERGTAVTLPTGCSSTVPMHWALPSHFHGWLQQQLETAAVQVALLLADHQPQQQHVQHSNTAPHPPPSNTPPSNTPPSNTPPSNTSGLQAPPPNRHRCTPQPQAPPPHPPSPSVGAPHPSNRQSAKSMSCVTGPLASISAAAPAPGTVHGAAPAGRRCGEAWPHEWDVPDTLHDASDDDTHDAADVVMHDACRAGMQDTPDPDPPVPDSSNSAPPRTSPVQQTVSSDGEEDLPAQPLAKRQKPAVAPPRPSTKLLSAAPLLPAARKAVKPSSASAHQAPGPVPQSPACQRVPPPASCQQPPPVQLQHPRSCHHTNLHPAPVSLPSLASVASPPAASQAVQRTGAAPHATHPEHQRRVPDSAAAAAGRQQPPAAAAGAGSGCAPGSEHSTTGPPLRLAQIVLPAPYETPSPIPRNSPCS
ncbi:MAG: hypothetical protein WDW38_004199 [Sanguina aurantia]